ncbi:MAG: hypothetical protein NZ934_02405, partial [Hadesarchaea archaeon]|nr:hypothetical protein [Hadesarchaea archaeon]
KLAERVIAIEPNMSVLGPRLREDAKLVVQALKAADPDELAKQLDKGSLVLSAGGREFKITLDEVKVVKETAKGVQKVEVVDIPEPPMTLLITP